MNSLMGLLDDFFTGHTHDGNFEAMMNLLMMLYFKVWGWVLGSLSQSIENRSSLG